MKAGGGTLAVLRPGLVPYLEGVALQGRLEAARLEGRIPDVLVVLEHPPVVTLGHRGNLDNVLVSEVELARRGVELHRASRGGDATYHGPGQVVAYPVVSLRALGLTVAELVERLEGAMIDLAAEHGVRAGRLEGKRGVFVGRDKLGAVGIHVGRGVTTHGLALNLDPDLAGFDLIVPCGLRENGVTSLARLLGRPPERRAIEDGLVARLAALLGLEPRPFECEAALLGAR